MSVSILHLTDIHAGPGELVDEDGKTRVPDAERLRQLDLLSAYLRELPTPDYVVVSGDISIQGSREGLEAFRAWLIQGIEEKFLPPADRILVVPGNHDVTYQKRHGEPRENRFRNFHEVFGFTFPHAFIPLHDPKISSSPKIPASGGGVFGGIEVAQEFGRPSLKRSLPFIMDMDREVLIYGFNSAHGSGVPLEPLPEIIKSLESIASTSGDASIVELAVLAREKYLDSLIVDAGLITSDQIKSFNENIRNIKRGVGKKFENYTKIAVLHHHLTNLWNQQIELKKFETTIDAAQLKQALTEHDFDIVLHGHKHTNHVGLDGSLIPVDRKAQFSPLCLISGGTIGGYPRLNDAQTFKLLELMGEKGPRTAAVVKEIKLRDAADPIAAIAAESRIFNVPLSHRIPDLHDINAVKLRLDNDLLAGLAPELAGGSGTRAERVQLPVSDTALFSEGFRYRCHSSLDVDGSQVYYEVIQATQRIGFTTISRIHWLVDSVLGGPGVSNKVVVIIGDLGDTHYSKALIKGEISESIQRLRTLLAPSISSGRLDLRVRKYAQDEVVKLTLGGSGDSI